MKVLSPKGCIKLILLEYYKVEFNKTIYDPLTLMIDHYNVLSKLQKINSKISNFSKMYTPVNGWTVWIRICNNPYPELILTNEDIQQARL